jgi:hypothetical protein
MDYASLYRGDHARVKRPAGNFGERFGVREFADAEATITVEKTERTCNGSIHSGVRINANRFAMT